MRIIRPLFFVTLLAAPTVLFAQQTREHAVLKGTVVDRVSRTPIQGVNIYFDRISRLPADLRNPFFREFPIGTATDSAGRFLLYLPLNREVRIFFSHVSYLKLVKTYHLTSPDTLFLETSLLPGEIQTAEVTVSARRPFSQQRARYIISRAEFQKVGERDMEHKLRYLLPTIVKPYEVRMIHPNRDFTLYINGKWEESDFLNDIDPATVTRIMVWEGLWSPLGFPLIRGGHVVSIETE